MHTVPTGETPELPSRLSDLPDLRQRQHMWRLLLTRTRSEVEQYVLARARPRRFVVCRPPLRRHLEVPCAQLGTDQLYHLVSGDRVICGGAPRRGVGGLWHDRKDKRIVKSGWGEMPSARWRFTLTGEILDMSNVAHALRCPLPPDGNTWASLIDPATTEGRQRMQLSRIFGHACVLCGSAPVVVDHCHFSGMVRGLLCSDCNVRVDSCAHVRGCRFADYLNAPPAERLTLVYAGKVKERAGDRERARVLGVASKAATPIAELWNWTPPRKPTADEQRRWAEMVT
jgi:hypothetical protein